MWENYWNYASDPRGKNNSALQFYAIKNKLNTLGKYIEFFKC